MHVLGKNKNMSIFNILVQFYFIKIFDVTQYLIGKSAVLNMVKKIVFVPFYVIKYDLNCVYHYRDFAGLECKF